MRCPACGEEMIVVERSGIELDYCAGCNGIWFDSGELELFAGSVGAEIELPDWAAAPRAESDERPRRCPRCRKKMDKILIGEILVDRCPRGHGLWFDGGELGGLFEQQTAGAPAGETKVIEFLGETFRVGGGG